MKEEGQTLKPRARARAMTAIPAAPQKRRSVTSVDLGELRLHVERASAMAGVGPSTWLRELVRIELAKTSGWRPEGAANEPDVPAPLPPVYRAWLDAGLTARLDERRRLDGFRSRAAVLRALIEGVGMTQGDGGSSEGGRRESVSVVVQALGTSNFQLVTIGRNLHQIAKMLRASPGTTSASERAVLEAAAAAIRQHVDQASKLVGQLRPMLRRAD